MVNSWGQIPGNCPDFNNILDGNVVKLKKMQQMLQDYSLAQLEHSAKLMGKFSTQKFNPQKMFHPSFSDRKKTSTRICTIDR